MKPYKVVLADDHVMVRQAIRTFIEKIDGVQICGEVSDGRELLNHLKISTPDLVILDIAMPHIRGLEALREIKKLYPNIKVLILSMHGDPEFVKQTVAAGGEGFILKEEPINDLMRAITAIQNGKKYFSAQLSGPLMSLVEEEKESELLTEREKEVLQYLARGISAQETSDALYISIHTVRRHRYNILQKLNMRSTAELIKYGISHGFAD